MNYFIFGNTDNLADVFKVLRFSLIVYEVFLKFFAKSRLFIEVSFMSGANVTGTFGSVDTQVSKGVKNPYSSRLVLSTTDLNV